MDAILAEVGVEKFPAASPVHREAQPPCAGEAKRRSLFERRRLTPAEVIQSYHENWWSRRIRRGMNRMYFEQFYLGCLAHASYMLGSQGEAVVVDPQRDVDLYLKAAEENGLDYPPHF